MNNRLHNATNPYQGNRKKVLCVCSAGLLRSPTAAWLLSNEPFGYNTRAAGVHDYALIPVDDVLIHWADEIVFMQEEHKLIADARFDLTDKVCKVLDIPDRYRTRDPELVKIIEDQYVSE